MAEITQTISVLPEAPKRLIDNEDVFVQKAEALFDAYESMRTEYNTLGSQVESVKDEINTAKDTVVSKEGLLSPHYDEIDAIGINITKVVSVADNIVDIQNAEENATLAINAKNDALTYKTDAEIAYANTVQTANVSKWVSGASYLEGNNVWSPIDFKTYRAKANTSGTTDPSLDSTNWAVMANVLGINSETIAISSNYQITRDNEIAINFTPSSNLIVTLPNATTITDSVVKYLYNNSSTYYIQVNDFGGAYKFTLSPKIQAIVTCVDTSTSSGQWVSQNTVTFNPYLIYPTVDIANSLDGGTKTSLIKHSIDSSNYYTLMYRNTSNNIVLQSIQKIDGSTSVTFGSSVTVASGTANNPIMGVALYKSANKGVIAYSNNTTLYVRTFTNINGTITLGTAYTYENYSGQGYVSHSDSWLFAIDTVNVGMVFQYGSDAYASLLIFNTTTNVFTKTSSGVGYSNYRGCVLASKITPGKYYTLAHEFPSLIAGYKGAYNVSAPGTNLYGSVKYWHSLKDRVTLIELAADVILSLSSPSLDVPSVMIQDWNIDSSLYEGSYIKLSGHTSNENNIVEVGNNRFLVFGRNSSGYLVMTMLEMYDNYKLRIVGETITSQFIGNYMLGKYVEPISKNTVLLYKAEDRDMQNSIINIKTK